MCGGGGKAVGLVRNVLPSDPKPAHYDLRIEPNFSDFTFSGVVTVQLTNECAYDKITFNAVELSLDSAVLRQSDSGEVVQQFEAADFSLDEKDMRATLALNQPITSGSRVALTVYYRGTMNDKMHGFYRSKFTLRGQEAFLGTTQFEAVDARRALPCWDEPCLKATFSVTLVVEKHLRALGNMPEIQRESTSESHVAVTFDKTPIMSTYLLAWTIGEMEVIERTIPKTRGGETLVRVFATEGKSQQGQFALDVACKVLPLYEDFFGSDYIIPKCDLLAIPDFAAGAMENWGLITYREVALLCDDSSSAVHRQWVALVVAHELAHQWFGNLVTMEWWKELWLNEAFATWVEYWAVDTLFPDWDIFTQFVNDECGRALQLDALRSSHPVEVDVVNAQEIDEIFDAISYSKGGSVLRMTIEFIGLAAFREGIQKYLKHYSFRNATTVDLWRFLGEAAGRDLAPILELWTGAQGYPFLTVDRIHGGADLSISQHRFLSTGDVKPEEDETIWRVPLLYLAEGSSNSTAVVLEQRDSEVPVPGNGASAAWVKVNSKLAAFCRVKYSTELLPSLVKAVTHKLVPNVDRLGLVADYHAFASGGYVSTVDVLQLLQGFAEEDDYTVWCAIVSCEGEIRNIVCTLGDEALAAFNAFFCNLYRPQLLKLGYLPNPASDTHRSAQLRGTLLSRLASLGDKETIAAALEMFQGRNEVSISADLRGAVYSTVVREGGSAEFETLKTMSLETTEAMERARCLRALGASSNPSLLHAAIDFGLSDAVRAQDAIYIFGAIAGNPKSQALYANALMEHWARFWARLPGMILSRIVKAIECSADSSIADKLTAFWATVDEQQRMAMERSFLQGVETIRANAKWAARDGAEISKFLLSLGH
eukprot:CAMPEP_0176409954 /NCGR_PEP_ID=MMETSP0127-20121128/2788_1 /TAXON_ID=938130 /ORGANISM="Platyophrya macrostoma, Strain WH" /LENGTH=880 /DNA_ID=CAMNT_0017789397 /DNA_START=31 /DNA_END=2673 /DNA_ORIENTATION=-